MSLDRTNPLDSSDGRYPPRPSTTLFKQGDFKHEGTPGDAMADGAACASGPCQLQVTIEIGDTVTEVRKFEPGEVLVGRRPRNDIAIDGEGLKVVSGYHLRFAYESGRWCVADKDSTNGTFLNGMRVSGLKAISDGDIVELGRPRKVGSYRSVKLNLALVGRPSVQSTAQSIEDLDPLDVTHSPDETSLPDPSPAPTKTALPKTAPPVAEEDDMSTDMPEGLLRTTPGPIAWERPDDIDEVPDSDVSDVVQAEISEVAEVAKPAAPVAPDVVPQKVPATKPAELRALIEKIQDRSRRLGEVSYRLDSHVQDLSSAVVERHAALGLADVTGSAGVLALLATHDGLESDLASLTSDLPDLEERLAKELVPLEASERKARSDADSANVQFAESALRRDESVTAFTKLYQGLTGSLREALGPVAELFSNTVAVEASDGSSLEDGDEPVWKKWTSALHDGVAEIEQREVELEAGRRDAESATITATAAERASSEATVAWEQAKSRADEHRESISSTVADKELALKNTMVSLEAAKGSLAEKAKEFVLGVLAAPEAVPGALGSLAGMDDARRLLGEADALRAELTELEHGAY